MTATAMVTPAPAVRRPVRARMTAWLISFAALTLLVTAIAPLIGSTSLDLRRALDRSVPLAENLDAQILFVARLPRVAAAAMVGGSLAAAGVVFQALLRNPLAEPFTLGISAGASFGAMLAFVLGTATSAPPTALASLVGAFVGAGIVYWLATLRRAVLSTSVLLLAGVTMNAFFASATMGLQYVADFNQIARAARFLMGDLDVGAVGPLLVAAVLIVPALGIFLTLPSSLNVLSLGPDAAASRGVDVHKAQRLAFVGAALATAGAVSLAGPVGFVGILVPHVVRLLVGSDHRIVLPGAWLLGAAFLVVCDLVSRTALPATSLPVGIITAVIGGPFFLWLLVRRG